MKIALTILLFFFHKLLAQVYVVDYIDTNNVAIINVEKGFIRYDLNNDARSHGVWRKTNKGNVIESSLYFKNSDYLIFRYKIYTDSSITYREYYKDGKLKSEIEKSPILSVDTWRQGDDTLLTPKVNILYIEARNGIYKSFYANGKLEQSGRYFSDTIADELKLGKWYYFYENGKIRVSMNYTIKQYTSLLDGLFFQYHPNGELKIKGTYNADLANSQYIDSLWSNQTVINSNAFVGIKDGVWKEYNKEGKLIKETTYKNGKEISTKEFD